MRLVVDASVYGDAVYSFDFRRTQLADKLFEIIISRGHVIVEPRIFSLELASLLSRRLGSKKAKELHSIIIGEVVIIDVDDDAILLDICFSTGARAADAYYIAAAKITSAILVSNDRRQVASARRYGVNAYYLLEEYEDLFERL